VLKNFAVGFLLLVATTVEAKSRKIIEPLEPSIVAAHHITGVDISVSPAAAETFAKLEAIAATKRAEAKLSPIDASAPVDPAAPRPEPAQYATLPFARMFPLVMEDVTRDVATALAWVHRNISKHGGDPERIIVGGHSSGAQLATLLCTDDRYLKTEGMAFTSLKGCIAVDGDTYDVPAIIETAETRRRVHGQPQPKSGHREKFGNDSEKHKNFSAVTHIAPGKNIPPFLILHVAEHPDNSAQAFRLSTALMSAGVPVQLFGARETNHTKINANLGTPNDPSTGELYHFLSTVIKK
jgi:hypothetical protein